MCFFARETASSDGGRQRKQSWCAEARRGVFCTRWRCKRFELAAWVGHPSRYPSGTPHSWVWRLLMMNGAPCCAAARPRSSQQLARMNAGYVIDSFLFFQFPLRERLGWCGWLGQVNVIPCHCAVTALLHLWRLHLLPECVLQRRQCVLSTCPKVKNVARGKFRLNTHVWKQKKNVHQIFTDHVDDWLSSQKVCTSGP